MGWMNNSRFNSPSNMYGYGMNPMNPMFGFGPGYERTNVPLFSLRKEDADDLKKIHHSAIICIVFLFLRFLFYIAFVILLFAASFSLSMNNASVWIGLYVGAGICLILAIVFSLLRFWYEWRIATRNKVLEKYYAKVSNNVIDRYFGICRRNKFTLYFFLINPIIGSIVDFWLVKETNRVLNLPTLSEQEEKLKQDEWIKQYTLENQVDPRLLAARQQMYNPYNPPVQQSINEPNVNNDSTKELTKASPDTNLDSSAQSTSNQDAQASSSSDEQTPKNE